MHKSILALASLFLIATHLTAQPAKKPPADGIYRIVEKGDGPRIVRDDTGAVCILGERLTQNLGAASITSQNRDNSLFNLHFRNAGPLPVGDIAPAGIVVGGRCYVINNIWNADADGSRSVGATFKSLDTAKTLAKVLKIEPFLREHPGHKFLVTFTPDKETYKLGDPMTLTMTIKNVGANTVSFFDGGQNRGPRDNQFAFIAMAGHGWGKAVPDTGDPTNFGGLGSYQTLKPGDTFKKPVSLDKWFKFEEADHYRVTGMFRMQFYVPGDPLHRVLWSDFAVGECVVRVEAPKE